MHSLDLTMFLLTLILPRRKGKHHQFRQPRGKKASVNACLLERKQQVALLLSQPENVRFPPESRAAVLNTCLQGLHPLAAVRVATGRGHVLQPRQLGKPWFPRCRPKEKLCQGIWWRDFLLPRRLSADSSLGSSSNLTHSIFQQKQWWSQWCPASTYRG